MTARLHLTTLFLDIGGVLLTNGWDHQARRRAANEFGLNYEEMNERHHLTFDTYENGKLSLEEYLQRTVFYQHRPFSMESFVTFMHAQSQRHDAMIGLVRALKIQYCLKVVAVSNEGRELTAHRIARFDLGEFIDIFISSCFVHFRKPDADIYKIALDISQASPDQVIYIDDRAMFVEVAQGLGIQSIHHTSFEATKMALDGFGLTLVKQHEQVVKGLT